MRRGCAPCSGVRLRAHQGQSGSTGSCSCTQPVHWFAQHCRLSPPAQASASAAYVLSTRGPVMRLAGHVTGLGLTERIYSVRFIGPVGYVVTYRPTDPLYTV